MLEIEPDLTNGIINFHQYRNKICGNCTIFKTGYQCLFQYLRGTELNLVNVLV